ncbi:hypothetical protein PV327_009784 [Microctonus hyperodae]|uniref:Odorant receptor n=1 Tax=Microctonus hyperodae TaxID=165561 RepID=A0AA39CBS2_MICHY|nr:hypothetical protein PV327_009784 [Microctonus hyperodae]
MDYYLHCHKLRHLKPNFHIKISLTIKRFIGIYLAAQTINLTIIWGDIERMVATAFLLMTNIVHGYKIIVIIRNQLRIKKLLNILTSPLFTRDNKKYERVFTYYAWQGIYHHIIYQSLGSMAVFCWSFIPIANAIVGLERRLPMDAWYPYDANKSPAFEITCAHQAIAVFIGCIHNISMDTLITGLLNAACCQLEVIKCNIKNLDLSTEESMEINRQRIMKEVIRCIHHTNIVMEFVMEMKSIFGLVIMSQLTVNSLIICLSAFHLTQMTIFIPTEAFGMMMYIFCMTYQIFIFCYHGNELSLQSQSVASAVFGSNWWKFNQQIKQSFGIMITRFHKPIVFTAGPLIKLSLNTFVNVLRVSYSFFTLLRNSTTND